MFAEKFKRTDLLHIKKIEFFSKIFKQIQIIFYFRFAVNQKASISQNSKTSKSKSFRQFMFAKSIRIKFISIEFLFLIEIMSKKSIVSSYKMHFIFENILYTFISRISFMFYSINMHESDRKCCIQNIETFQQINQSKVWKSKRIYVEQYVDRHFSNISLMILIKKINFYTCRRCFRIFRSNNDLHEHFRCIHLKYRRRRRFIEQISQRLNQLWRKIWREISNYSLFRTQFMKTIKSMNEKRDEFFISLHVLLINFL